MTRPLLTTKFRGVGQTECEVFQEANGVFVSKFVYGTAGLHTATAFNPGGLATHWNGAIYAICPDVGIYKNTPPSSTGLLFHSFTSPDTGANGMYMDWQTVFKNNKTQLFTLFSSSTTSIRMVFIDEEDNVTETGPITISTAFLPAYTRGINYGNKIYTTRVASSSATLQIVDPVLEIASQITFSTTTYQQSDLAVHSGILYGFTQQNIVTLGEGNALWNMSSAVPYKALEWNGYNTTAPAANGQCCIFSDGTDLIVIGNGSGTLNEEFDVWKIDFENNIPVGITSVRDTTFGFNLMVGGDESRYYASRDLETSIGDVRTNIAMVTSQGELESSPIHRYRWNGVNNAATYLGVGGSSFAFDAPSWKIGGGSRTFTNEDELDFIITNTSPSGANIDITYIIKGSAPISGVAMSIVYNNLKNSPMLLASVVPVTNGFTSGNYIAGLTTNQSGVFRWNIAQDGIISSDIPNVSAILTRV